MSKHTPGPWHVRYCDDDRHMCMTAISAVPVPDANVDQYDAREEHMVAIVYHQTYPYVRPEDTDGAEANARLIAAAPDLLEALKEARTSVLWERDFFQGSCTPGFSPDVDTAGERAYVDRLIERIARIDAAIAKAEGRS